MEKEKKKSKYNEWQTVGFMLRTAWEIREKKVIFIMLSLVVLNVGQNLVGIFITPGILAALERRASLGELCLTILGFVGATMLLQGLSTYASRNWGFGLITVRSAILGKIVHKCGNTSYQNVLVKDFDKKKKAAKQATAGNGQPTEAVWLTMQNLLKNIVGFAIYCVLLSGAQPLLIAVILVTAVVGWWINRWLDNWTMRYRDEAIAHETHTWYLSHDIRKNELAKDIRIFGLRPWLAELWREAIGALVAFRRREEGAYLWGKVVNLLLVLLQNGVAYAYLIGMVLRDGLSASEFLLYFSVVGGFSGWIRGILNNANTLHKQSIILSEVMELLEYPEPFRFEEGDPLPPAGEKGYEIRMEKVSFTYPDADAPVLKDVDLILRPGEKLAVVGRNGAGKTTLVLLLCGFLDPTEGRVLLNGVDIRTLDRRAYYGCISAVFQNFQILALSVAANIAQSDTDIDMDRVRRAAEMAGLTEKIESLPQGFDTLLNREVYEQAVMLSGGETQRLMMARALYKPAELLVLDEPTAALDPLAEARVYAKYNEMSRGKTSVYISHRLASTRFCDRVIYLADGRVAETGTHEELVAAGGGYAELFEIQSRYYREGGDGNEEN